MILSAKDFDILEKFEFDVQPVGVKFLAQAPSGLERLDQKMSLCEMLKSAQEGRAFYADKENHACGAGPFLLNQVDGPGDIPRMVSGEFAAALKVFEEPRSASRLYDYLPRISKGVANFVALSPLSALSFDPDVLIVLAKTGQTEILLRAMSYRTGKMWSSKSTPIIGCAWIFVYPFLTGELNYTVTGLSHGMKRRNLFPEGRQLVSIPFDLLRSMLETLREMPWVLPSLEPDGAEFFMRTAKDLGLA